MLYSWLLLVALPADIKDITVRDARRFANYSYDTASKMEKQCEFFGCYLCENPQGNDDFLLLKGSLIYRWLGRAVEKPGENGATEASILAALRLLRRELGKEAFAKGRIPPPIPKKFEKDFKVWLDEKFKAGLTTPEMISDAARAARDRKLALEQKNAEAQRARQEQRQRDQQKRKEKEQKEKEQQKQKELELRLLWLR